jgi:uncharacterized protein
MFDEEIDLSATFRMTPDPDHGFGLLSSDVQERLEQIINERSGGVYGVPALHGMLTASVVGPKPVPLDQIVRKVLRGPDSEGKGFDHFPEFSWATEKIGELFLRISRVFQQDPETFRLPICQSKLKEGDTMPDLRTWCLGFVEGMMFRRKDWEPLLSIALPAVAPIVMTADPDGWREKDNLNPFSKMAPSKLCEGLKLSAQTIHAFWPFYNKNRGAVRASVAPGRNDACPCGSGRKFKRCCRRAG